MSYAAANGHIVDNEHKLASRSKDGEQSRRDGAPLMDHGPLNGKITHQLGQLPVIDIKKDLSALILQQMKATPDAVALEDETTTLTYAELNDRVTVLATRLRDHGVGRDSLVGVLLGRSADYVIACLAALRAGGAFLVLELAYPPGLLADVIEDAKPVVVITQAAQAGQIKTAIPLIILNELEANRGVGGVREHSPLPPDDDLERLAFVSYSSGTVCIIIQYFHAAGKRLS